MNIYTSEAEMLLAQCKEWKKVCDQHLRHIKKLKKQREWVGLTDNEIALTHADYPHPQSYARAIEAKLKEKNHG